MRILKRILWGIGLGLASIALIFGCTNKPYDLVRSASLAGYNTDTVGERLKACEEAIKEDFDCYSDFVKNNSTCEMFLKSLGPDVYWGISHLSREDLKHFYKTKVSEEDLTLFFEEVYDFHDKSKVFCHKEKGLLSPFCEYDQIGRTYKQEVHDSIMDIHNYYEEKSSKELHSHCGMAYVPKPYRN